MKYWLMLKKHLKYVALPLLISAYPILFLYGHNAWSLSLGSLTLPLAITLLTAVAAYGGFFLGLRRRATASLAAGLFMVFYFLYGLAFRQLTKLDRFPVEHYVLLPLVVVLAIYAGYGVSRLKLNAAKVVQKVLLIISSLLVVYNLAVITPVEIDKAVANDTLTPSVSASSIHTGSYPDIYYIVFDEYAGFDAIREYWHEDYVDEFEAFLKDKGFFVANNSRSATLNTSTEITSRLDLHQYSEVTNGNVKLLALNNNQVMRVLKSYGYATVAIDMAFPGIKADLSVKFNPSQVGGMAADEFNKTFNENSMAGAFSGLFEDSNQAAIKQRTMIMYSLDKTANLPEVKSPKFVYTHVLLPHEPFIFDKDGNLLPPQAADDWHYYLGQHEYATKLAQQLLTQLLAQADPKNPPVIIFQSDHGARNFQRKTKDNIIMNGYLEDYPAKYNQYIVNALYLPGFDTSTLSDDFAPVKTFEIVLNHYLDAGVAVDNVK